MIETEIELIIHAELTLPVPFDSKTMLENYNWLLNNPGKRPKIEDSWTEEDCDVYDRFHPYISEQCVRYGGLEFEYFLGAYVGGLPPEFILPGNDTG